MDDGRRLSTDKKLKTPFEERQTYCQTFAICMEGRQTWKTEQQKKTSGIPFHFGKFARNS
jgi:hypothetical protein